MKSVRDISMFINVVHQLQIRDASGMDDDELKDLEVSAY